jgi:hypothetical protein
MRVAFPSSNHNILKSSLVQATILEPVLALGHVRCFAWQLVTGYGSAHRYLCA